MIELVPTERIKLLNVGNKNEKEKQNMNNKQCNTHTQAGIGNIKSKTKYTHANKVTNIPQKDSVNQISNCPTQN